MIVKRAEPLRLCHFYSQLFEQSGGFSRHARAGGHPAFSAKHFWIPAFAGMTSLEWKNSPTPQLFKSLILHIV
jgi:hypothetical protein